MFYLGIDVSKKKLDVALLLDLETLKKRQKKVANTADGFAQLIAWVGKQTAAAPSELYAVMEATGPYHEALADALYAAGWVGIICWCEHCKNHHSKGNTSAFALVFCHACCLIFNYLFPSIITLVTTFF